MTKEDIRKTVIDAYIKNDYDFTKTVQTLAEMPEPFNTLTKKQIQGILVFAKVWKPLEKKKRETKRITKKDILPELEKLGLNTEGLEDATLKALQNVLEWATKLHTNDGGVE